MKKRFLLLSISIAVISTITLFSQSNPIDPVQDPSPVFLGPVFGFNKSMHSVELKTFAKQPLCPTFVDGSDNGFYAGLSFEYMLGEVESSNSSIIARLLYNSFPASLEQSDLELPSRVSYINGTDTVDAIENTSILHLNSVQYNTVTFEAMYKFNPIQGSGLGITFGPTFDFALAKTQEQRMDLIHPLNAQFKRPGVDSPDYDPTYVYENNDRSIVISDGDIPNSSAFRLGFKVGLQYELLMGGGMYLVPAAYYNLGITDLASDFNWRVNALQIGVDLRFSIDRVF